MGQINTTTLLETTSCPGCGVEFAAPATLLRARRDTGDSYYCPNGHSLSFKKTETQRLREALDLAKANCQYFSDQQAAAERSNNSLRGANTRLRRQLAEARAEL